MFNRFGMKNDETLHDYKRVYVFSKSILRRFICMTETQEILIENVWSAMRSLG